MAGELTAGQAAVVAVVGSQGFSPPLVVSGARIAPSRDRRTEVRERSARCGSDISGGHQGGDSVLVDPRRCLSQRIVVGRGRAPRGEEERRDGKGRSTCENSLIQPRTLIRRRSAGTVKWGFPKAPALGRDLLVRGDSPPGFPRCRRPVLDVRWFSGPSST